MTPAVKRKFSRFCRKTKRRLYRKIYNILATLYTKDYRISVFFTLCTVLVLVILLSLFVPRTVKPEMPDTSSVLGSELTHAIRSFAKQSGRADLDADVTLFLLPAIDESTDLEELLSAPLYGFYLTGRELRYLPEYYASLADSFPSGIPYTGGLSFTYNPHRIICNRATEIFLLRENGAVEQIKDQQLYYVLGSDLAFSMFCYLSERTFHLMNIRPKDSSGALVSDCSRQLLKGKDGSLTLYSIYKSYLEQPSSDTVINCSQVLFSTSVNAWMLFHSANIAGAFVMSCFFLLLVLACLLRPYLYRMYIRFRVSKVRRRKRGKATLQLRLTRFRKKRILFFKKLLTNHAA